MKNPVKLVAFETRPVDANLQEVEGPMRRRRIMVPNYDVVQEVAPPRPRTMNQGNTSPEAERLHMAAYWGMAPKSCL